MAALSRYENGLKMNEISGLLKVSTGNVDWLADDGMLVRVAVPGDRRATVALDQPDRKNLLTF